MKENGINRDRQIYELYSKYVNESYPAFLKKLGLDCQASFAESCTITDSGGKTYIDCVGGYGVFNLGHNNERIVNAVIDQLNKKSLITRPLIIEANIEVAEIMREVLGGQLESLFLCNSGSEAIDTSMKLARLCTGRKEIITATNSFHGFTFGALSATGIPAFKRSFEPLVPGIEHVPFGDIDALCERISERTAAILLEPVQHEAGIHIPPKGYFYEVRRLCDELGVLLILDEIKTGVGKTGRMFAMEHFDVIPDILVLGKSFGGGIIPIGAVIGKKKLWKKFSLSFAMSASSFAGNALACRAAIETITIVREGDLLENCVHKGARILDVINSLVLRYGKILKSVRGMGLLVGIETRSPKVAFAIAREMISLGVLIFPSFGNSSVLMVEPPLVITMEQVDEVLDAFDRAFYNVAFSDSG